MVGSPENTTHYLQKIQSSVERILIGRYNRQPEKGEIYCAYIHLARQTTFGLSRYHRQNDPATLLVFQKLLMGVLTQDPSKSKKHLAPLFKELKMLLVEKIMKRPRKVMPGCRICRFPCYFGHIFQIGNKIPVKTLRREIDKQRKVGKTPVYTAGGKLSRQVHKFVKFELQPGLVDDAAYCWIVNAATHQANFSYFWKSNMNKNKNQRK